MALESNRQFIAQDALPIVFYADQAHTACHQPHGDLAGTCVQRVVHQLAHHRGRALHDLTGRNLADQFVGEFTDWAAGG